MNFTLDIDCDNVAFEGEMDRVLEIERILSKLAKYVRSEGISPGESIRLRDINGNTVGEARLSESEEKE